MPPRNDLLEHARELFPAPDDGLHRVWQQQRRRHARRRVAAIAVAACIVALGALVASRLTHEAPEPDPATPTPALPDVSTDVSIVDLDTGLIRSADWNLQALAGAGDFQISPDGSTVVFEGEPADGSGTQLYLAEADGGDIRRLTADPISATEGSWSPDGTEIVFRSGFDQGAQIAVIDVESGDVRSITNEGLVFDPSFGPSNTILFTRGRPRSDGGLKIDLWRVPASGGNATVAVPSGAFGSSSPDGQTIAYHGTSHHVGCFDPCWEVDPRISFADVGEPAPDPSGFSGIAMSVDVAAESAITWSPDGRAVMADQPRAQGMSDVIVVADVKTGQDRVVGWGDDPSWLDSHSLVVTDFSAGPDLRPPATEASFVHIDSGTADPLPDGLTSFDGASHYLISPDGEQILFQAYPVDAAGGPKLFVGNIDGTGVEQVTTGLAASQARWSPNGDRIVYRRSTGVRTAIEVLELRTRSTTTLIRDAVYAAWPSFSADGNTVLFTMAEHTDRRTPKVHLWTVPATGGEPTQLIDWGAYGTFSPDGATIAYHETAPQPEAYCGVCWWIGSGVKFVPSDGSVQPGFQAGGTVAPPQVFEMSVVEWSPDGTSVVYLRPGSDAHDIRLLQEGRNTLIGFGGSATWFDDHTLIVTDYRESA